MNTALTLVIGAAIGSSVGRATDMIGGSLSDLKKQIDKLDDKKVEIMNGVKKKVEIQGVTTEVVNLARQISPLNKQLEHLNYRYERFNNIANHKSKIDNNILDLTKLTAVAYGFKGIISSAQDVAKAQGEIASLGIGAKGIDIITKSARDFTNQFAGTTTPEFIRASYDIKSGISSLTDEGVAEFTRLSAMTAKATKSTTAEMTKAFALGYGVFRKQFETDEEFGNTFSIAVSSAVKGFRTTGSDLSGSISRLGAMAVTKGVTLTEQFATIGMLKSTFDSASEAATGFTAFLGGVGKAQNKLGLKFTDSSGKMLPVVEILELIKGKYGSLEDVATQDLIKEAFGSDEAVKMITGLIGKTEALRQANINLNNDIKVGTLTEDMANAMSAGDAFDLLGNRLLNLSSVVGKTLVPTLTMLSELMGRATVWISSLIEKFPLLTGILGSIIVSMVGMVIMFKAGSIITSSLIITVEALRLSKLRLVTGINFLTTTLTRQNIATALSTTRLKIASIATASYGTVTKVASVGIGILSTAFRTLTVAMMANPIGLIIGGVIALGAGAYMLIKHWSKAKEYFMGFWEFLQNMFGKIGEIIGVIGSFASKIFGGGEVDIKVDPGGNVPKPRFPLPTGPFPVFGDTESPIDKIANSKSLSTNSHAIAYSPQIIVQGVTDKQMLEQVLSDDKVNFKKMYDEMTANNNRLSFSGA